MRGVVLGALMGALLAAGAAAQPAPDVDRDHAKQLYNSAEAAMQDGRFADAVRDYGESYELSKQPALFYKIARANEKAGKCDVALIYYARYLREGKPSDSFVATTKERIKACGGDPDKLPGTAPPPPAPPKPPEPAKPPEPTPPPPAGSGSGSAAPVDRSDVGHSVLGGAAGSAAETPLHPPSAGHKAAWLLMGTSIGLVTIGGVLAYAASSSENDIQDLYVSALGQPPVFNDATRKRYNDLIDEGHNYEHLSWVALGLAGAVGVGAAILFLTTGDDDPSISHSAEHARVTPIIAPNGGGISVRF
jgi:tetratricopeptide (TPR) repeat protein